MYFPIFLHYIHFSYTSTRELYYICKAKEIKRIRKTREPPTTFIFMAHTPSNKAKDNPKLRERPITDGKTALYLEYYLGYTSTQKLDEDGRPMYYTEGKSKGRPIMETKHNRRKEGLGLYLYAKPRTAEERAHNKNTLELAQRIRNERERELLAKSRGYSITRTGENIMPYLEDYLAHYSKKDRRNIILALNRFKDFLRFKYPSSAMPKTPAEQKHVREEWQESHKGVYGRHDINPNAFYLFHLNPRQFNASMVREFVEYLQQNSEGSGAATAYARFKKMVKACHDAGRLPENPCEGVTCKRGECHAKDILSADEIAALQRTHTPRENEEIRRAFLFTLYTGVRFCDVVGLRYSNVDYQNGALKFEQAKTGRRVEMPLIEGVLRLVGTPEERGRARGDAVFLLPSHTACLKALRHWCAAAGITKRITWHCGRHSFATNLLENGANIKVVSELLGHSGLKYVERYTRAIDESKRRALASLPPLEEAER